MIFPNFFVNFTKIFKSITDLLGFIAKKFGNIPKLMVEIANYLAKFCREQNQNWQFLLIFANFF